MKIVFFSDAHGNQYAFHRFMDDLQEIKPDLIVFGGDVFGYYYGQQEIISLLRKLNCICLLGNHDNYFLNLLDGKINRDYLVGRYGSSYQECMRNMNDTDVQFVRGLKPRYDYSADGLHLAFVHGSMDDPINGRVYPDTDIKDYTNYEGFDFVFFGHTHHKLIKKLDDGTVLVNPGSIGQQRDGKGCTYVVFDTVSRDIEFREVQFNIEGLVSEIKLHHETSEMEYRLVEVLFRDKRGQN